MNKTAVSTLSRHPKPPVGKPQQSEAQLQSNCVIWFKNTFRDLAPLYYQVKNDGKKSKRSGSLDTALGLTPGIPDTFLAIPMTTRGKPTHGLYIEFKTLTGTLSAQQKKVIPQLQEQGYRVEVVRTEEEFRELILSYLKLVD